MSLHVLANHMAEKGRGPDTMLVHMAPSEVHGLQALAQAHGGSLTINPETGLPEAGFLDKLLPAIIGFGVTALSGGAIPGWQIALGVGGVEAARTGDLGKGIAAGLGAYGGAGLGESLATAGATQVAGDQLAQQALEQGATGTQQQIAQNITPANIAPANIAAAREATSTSDLLSKGFDAAKADPMKFAQANWKPMAAAALPVLSDVGTTTQMPGMSQAPGQVHRFSFDPYGQNYTSIGNYQVPVTGANGGLMDMANGGIAHFDDGGGVAGMYQNVLGRAAKPEELDYWNNAFKSQNIVDPTQQLTQFKAAAAPEVTGEVNNIYRNVLGRDADVGGLNYWTNALTTGNQSLNDVYQGLLGAATTNKEIVNKGVDLPLATSKYTGYEGADTGTTADEWVRNTLNREATAADKNSTWYKQALAGGKSPEEGLAAYNNFLQATGQKTTTDMGDVARASQLKPLNIIGLPPDSVVLPDGKSVVTQTGTLLPIVQTDTGQKIVVNATGQTTNAVDTPTVLNEASKSTLPVGVSGNQTATINPNGTVSMNTGTPNMPVGGYTGMQSLRDAYTKDGGSLGYAPVAPKTMAEFNQKYNTLTGGSKQAYDYLMGGDYSPTPYTKTGEVMKPYSETVLGVPGDVSKKRYLFDPASRSYKLNPDYVPITYDSKGNKLVGVSNKDVASYVNANKDAATSDYQKWMADNNISLEQVAGALGISLAEAKRRFGTGTTAANSDAATLDNAIKLEKDLSHRATGGLMAGGGLAAMANGGYDLGSYSDGGRLLRGPGDGVSDSIPATIGKGRPARLADGEFVVPARIVSEIGNGSTEAGARKLYAMMDRVQAARRNSIGKGNVAKNSRADKYLPA